MERATPQLRRFAQGPMYLLILGLSTLSLTGCYTQLAATDYDEYERRPSYVEGR